MASTSEYEQKQFWDEKDCKPINYGFDGRETHKHTGERKSEVLYYDAQALAKQVLQDERDKWFSADKKQNK